jgi:cellulose biosynthesis protein BcsQ
VEHLPLGKILTFYSYKGGTGRSMAVVNFGCWLARQASRRGRILLIDWDLEAPGLHRYFPATDSVAAARQDGLIDYFWAVRDGLAGDGGLYQKFTATDGVAILRKAFPLSPYISRDVFPGVDLIRAGRFEADYAQRVSAFDWVDFHRQYGEVFRLLREMIVSDYSYCLIDSRTGFNDVSGVCTMLMPEKLVLVFTPNRQSLSGVLDLAARAVNYRRAADDFRPLAIFPVASRIENAELELKQRWRKTYQDEFEATLKTAYQLDECGLTEYFDDVVLPHVSFYSFGEEIAILREKHSDALSLRRAYDNFFQRLDTTEFAWDALASASPPIDPRPAPAPVERVDVFISYAHIDNQSLLGESQGWVDAFSGALEMRLSQFLGGEVRLWRDRKLSGDLSLWHETTDQHIREARVFVSILSPAYLQSDYCRRELETFLAHAGTASRHGTRRNLFKVLKWPVERVQEPKELREVLGFAFYRTDEGGAPREFIPDTNARDLYLGFIERIHQLAFAISQSLRAESTPGPRVGESGIRSIYVAETSSDIGRDRDGVVSELKQHGFRVLPDVALPPESLAMQAAVREHLARSDASVHMIGQRYGIIPEGDQRSHVELQWELAAEYSLNHPSFSKIVWIPPDLTPADPRLGEFVNRLEDTVGDRVDVLKTNLEYLKSAVLAMLDPTPPRPTGERALAFVYLICDNLDADAVLPISRYLDERGCEVATSLGDDQSVDAARYHRERLVDCDAVLIYYGRADQRWLTSKIWDLRKSSAWGRTKPLVSSAVMLGAPRTPEKESFRSRQVAMVIDAIGRAPDDVLPNFVEQLQHGASKT